MKRLSLLLGVMLIFGFAVGCGQQPSKAGFTKADLYLNIDGKQYHNNTAVDAVFDHFGLEYEYAEGQSCDYEGLDKIFIYDETEFYTWPLPEGDYINEIYTRDPVVTSSKGLSVGSTKEEVLNAYGDNYEDDGYLIIYRTEDASDGSLCFEIDNGLVSAVYITLQDI